MIVVIDNTRNQKVKMFLPKLINYLRKNNIVHTVVDGDVDGLKKLKTLLQDKQKVVSGVILSGSPIMLNENSNIEDYICNIYCIKHLNNIPILGICFGCQIINVHFGGTLYDMQTVHCKRMHIHLPVINVKSTDKLVLTNGTAKFCCRYIPQCVSSKYFDTRMYVQLEQPKMSLPCVITHRHRKLIGVMFHPEALQTTHYILDYFLALCK